ncbi:hypothetical protein AXX16_3322 [Serratia rubidaea]|nr:hypothetical protein AXX16_3322 [Serratia rubidaea]
MTRAFDIQIVQPLSIYKGNTQLFLLSCVNQHSFHLNLLVIFYIIDRAAGNISVIVQVALRRGLLSRPFMLPNARAVAALAPPELFGHNLYGRVKTENPVSSRKAVNLPVVACIGAHYLGKPVFLCEKQHFYSGNSL